MFLNQRSAVLQLLSAGNFINWTDNNPLMVAKAIGNPKQLVKDMLMIINSDKLVQRRSGLRFSIEEAELANIGGAEFRKGKWNTFTMTIGEYLEILKSAKVLKKNDISNRVSFNLITTSIWKTNKEC